MTYAELKTKFTELFSRTGRASIKATEILTLITDLIDKILGIDVTATATIRKSYDTLALANADLNPIDPETAKPIKIGQLITVVADTTLENNAVYRLSAIGVDGTPTWERQAALGDMSTYQKVSDATFSTATKTVPGAINELQAGKINIPAAGNLAGDILVANSETPGDASFKTLENAGVAKHADLVQLAGEHETDVSYIRSNSIIDLSYVQDGKLITSTGEVGTYAGGMAIVDMPLKPNTKYTIGADPTEITRVMALSDISGNAANIVTLYASTNIPPISFITTDTNYFLRLSVKHPSEADNIWFQSLIIQEGGTVESKGIKTINDKPLIASYVDKEISFAIAEKRDYPLTEEYIDLNSDSINLINPNKIISGIAVNSSAAIVPAAGWKTLVIDISRHVGKSLTWGGLTYVTNQTLYYAFTDKDKTVISSSYFDKRFTNTVTIPVNAKWFYLDLINDQDTDANYENGMLNLGTELLPYEPYNPYLVEIAGIPIRGAESNIVEGGDVSFNIVTAKEVNIDGTIKQGTLAAPPANLVTGEFWLDTTDSIDNPIIRRKA